MNYQIIRPEDCDYLEPDQVDVQDDSGNSYGPFGSEKEAFMFIKEETEMRTK